MCQFLLSREGAVGGVGLIPARMVNPPQCLSQEGKCDPTVPQAKLWNLYNLCS